MLQTIAKACSNVATLDALRSRAISSPDVVSLLDNVRGLNLSHFGPISSSRSAYTVLPDALYALEREHPLRLAAAPPASFFHPENPNSVQENGSHELICNMQTIFEPSDKSYTMQVFMLPRGCVMPLHDHPGMAVISKILLGKIDMTTYSLLPPTSPKAYKLPKHLASTGRVKEVVPQGRYLLKAGAGEDSMTMIYPDTGNLHAIRALEPTIFFDILTPPYVFDTDCTYYRLHRISGETGQLVGSEAELKSVHTQYPAEATTDKYFVEAFDPVYFQCYSVPAPEKPLVLAPGTHKPL